VPTVNVAVRLSTQGQYISTFPIVTSAVNASKFPSEHVQFYGIVRFNVASNYRSHLEASQIEVYVCPLQALSPPIGGAGMRLLFLR
jgi:hypothetical protein